MEAFLCLITQDVSMRCVKFLGQETSRVEGPLNLARAKVIGLVNMLRNM